MAHGHLGRGRASSWSRREAVVLLGLGLVEVLAGCDPDRSLARGPAGTVATTVPGSGEASTVPSAPVLIPSPVTAAPVAPTDGGPFLRPPMVPPAAPLTAPVVSSTLAAGSNALALTIDDGYDEETVAAYVRLATDTGLHLTFNPNAQYGRVWEPHAPALRPLVAAGQVQIGNHTFHHRALTKMPDGAIRAELETNEEWVQRVFATTTRPYLRPPYGSHNARTDKVAFDSGWGRIVMWDGSFGDAVALTPAALLAQAQRYLLGGHIVLGHANHPTVTHLYGQVLELIHQRNLAPATLDEAFGTTRGPVPSPAQTPAAMPPSTPPGTAPPAPPPPAPPPPAPPGTAPPAPPGVGRPDPGTPLTHGPSPRL